MVRNPGCAAGRAECETQPPHSMADDGSERVGK